jgi:hypothetical protein
MSQWSPFRFVTPGMRLLSLNLCNSSRPALILRDPAGEVPYVLVRMEQVLMYWQRVRVRSAGNQTGLGEGGRLEQAGERFECR